MKMLRRSDLVKYTRFMQVVPVNEVPDSVVKRLSGRVGDFDSCSFCSFYEKWVEDRLYGVCFIQPVLIDEKSKCSYRWVYVGDLWWCRRLVYRGVEKFDFGRFVAVDSQNKFVGVWDDKLFSFVDEPVVVYKVSDGSPGVVTGWNEFEFFVRFNNRTESFSSFDGFDFKFVEDFNKFKKMVFKKNG